MHFELPDILGHFIFTGIPHFGDILILSPPGLNL